MKPISISVIMPAHKELDNLLGAVVYVSDEITYLVNKGVVSDWEIIIVDSIEKDGTTDGTPKLADRIVKRYENVRVIHNDGYVNLGHKYTQGLAEARFDYFMMVPGKNTLHSNSIVNLLSKIPENGIVIGYQADMSRRPFKRRLISRLFTIFMNFVFRLNLKYYNGTTVIPTKILRELNPNADDFAYMAEILVILLKRYQLTYTQVPFYTKGKRSYGKTRATSWGNVVGVTKTVLRLIKKMHYDRSSIVRMFKELLQLSRVYLPWMSIEKKFRFAEVDKGKLLRSAAPSRKALDHYIKRYGLRSLIVLIEDANQDQIQYAKSQGLKICYIIIAPGYPPGESDIKKFINFVSDNDSKPSLVYCWQGRDRTGCLCLTYRMRVMGWSFNNALLEMLDLGHMSLPWHANKLRLIKEWLENLKAAQ